MTEFIDEEVLIALRRILRAIAMQSKQLQQKFGITIPQLLILKALDQAGLLSVGALSKKVNLSQATVTAIIDRLEKRNFVVRKRSDTDRRCVHVSVTEQSRNVLKEAPSPIQEQFKKSFSDLENWEQTLILSSLQRIAHMMDVANLPAAPLLYEDTLSE